MKKVIGQEMAPFQVACGNVAHNTTGKCSTGAGSGSAGISRVGADGSGTEQLKYGSDTAWRIQMLIVFCTGSIDGLRLFTVANGGSFISGHVRKTAERFQSCMHGWKKMTCN
ncbi:hypothetical protein TB2_008406 [Malus domestica]